MLLYHLQRHSDHHANPTRRYQTLRDFEESPALPTGYAGMIVLALVPPLWRRVMDPRVLAHFDGDMSRANISPRKRERILARVPAAAVDGGSTASTPAVARQARPASERGRWPPAAPAAATPTTSGRRRARGLRARHRRGPTSPTTWGCPDCGVREKVDFVTLVEATRLSGMAAGAPGRCAPLRSG